MSVAEKADKAEFDAWADRYVDEHRAGLGITGEEPEYFARYKADHLAAKWAADRRPPPRSLLDFGCGVGGTLPFLRTAFPSATAAGLDVSAASLAEAGRKNPEVELVCSETPGEALAGREFDLIFTACVFHHIPHERHVSLLAELRGLLAPGGLLALYEHNPFNPVTRWMVATCPFDENAVLIRAGEMRKRMRAAGFGRVETAFIGYFPKALAALRPTEKWFERLPAGAQYAAFATV